MIHILSSLCLKVLNARLGAFLLPPHGSQHGDNWAGGWVQRFHNGGGGLDGVISCISILCKTPREFVCVCETLCSCIYGILYLSPLVGRLHLQFCVTCLHANLNFLLSSFSFHYHSVLILAVLWTKVVVFPSTRVPLENLIFYCSRVWQSVPL